MRDTIDIARKPGAFYGKAALVLAGLQIILAAWSHYAVQSQIPKDRDLEWGEGMGMLMFFESIVAIEILLVLVGLALTITAAWRRELPKWPFCVALVIYVPAGWALVLMALRKF